MGAGVMAGYRTIESPADDLAVVHHDSPHRHLPQPGALSGQHQRLAHEIIIAGAVNDHRPFHTETRLIHATTLPMRPLDACLL